MVDTPQLSVAVAVPIFPVDVHIPASVVIFAVAGQEITGASLSVTTSLYVTVVEFPAASVTTTVQVVVPTG